MIELDTTEEIELYKIECMCQYLDDLINENILQRHHAVNIILNLATDGEYTTGINNIIAEFTGRWL